MPFLNISNLNKRDLIVKEFVELKKNIRDDMIRERTGEQQLQTDLSKFFKPITETQKDTAREITEGLKPIKEGIEKLPQHLGKEEEGALEGAPGEAPENLGEIAEIYLNRPTPDETFGIRKKKDHYKIRRKKVTIFHNNIFVDNEKYESTPGLKELITSKKPKSYTKEDEDNYERLMLKTNALCRKKDPSRPKASGGYK